MNLKNKQKNLKLYPKYRRLSMDFLFFYTINVLFLTQVKHIDMSAVVLVDTFYALFVVLVQIPSTYIVGKIGRKSGMILGNICNALYLILVINSTNLIYLIIAEIMCALGFSLKDMSEPAILNESINKTNKEKSDIFAHIQSKAVSGYYVLSAISMIISGFLFEINGYIPMFLSLAIVIISLLMSTRFEDVEKDINEEDKDELENKGLSIKDTIKFAFSSTRFRCLLIFSSCFYGIITILATYEITLLEELDIPSRIIGILFAFLNIVSAFASRKQDKFQEKLKNKTMTVLGLSLSVAIILSGLIGSLNINIYIILGGLLIMYMLKYVMVGFYNVLLIKYLSNFTNSKIDTKIFAINSFLSCVLSAIMGIFASYLLEIMNTSKAMIIVGSFSFIIFTIVIIYMRNKVGLKPDEYSEYELQFENKE